ncbi:alpha/beta fold hydrolase [Treponema sp. HNW]|uniref:alpha/beta hydrolase n=1 Tax=Treponema sp. HNW TaxID=3116654 RepID=UPI003D15273B
MLYISVIVLAAAGFVIFSFAGGFVLFRFLCIRSVYSARSFVDNAAHVKDEKVITPLLEAKNNRDERSFEKVSILSASRRLFRLPLAPLGLSAELRLQKKPKDFAVLVHGFSDSARGMTYLSQAYYNCGFSVLSIDMRAHGESEGRFTGLGYTSADGADIALWLRYLRGRFGDDIRIVLHGVSMGASAAIQSAYGLIAVKKDFEAERKNLKLVVADCGFFRFSDQVEHQLALFLSSGLIQRYLFKCIAFAASCLNFFVNGFFFTSHNPGKTLQLCSEHADFTLLLFHGSSDTLVPPDAARQLYEAARCPKKLVFIQDAPHIGSWFYDTKTYMDTITLYFRGKNP